MTHGSPTHLIRLQENTRRKTEAECFGSLQVDDQREFGGSLHGQVRRPGALQNLVHIG